MSFHTSRPDPDVEMLAEWLQIEARVRIVKDRLDETDPAPNPTVVNLIKAIRPDHGPSAGRALTSQP